MEYKNSYFKCPICSDISDNGGDRTIDPVASILRHYVYAETALRTIPSAREFYKTGEMVMRLRP